MGWSTQSLQALRSQLCQNGGQLLTGCPQAPLLATAPRFWLGRVALALHPAFGMWTHRLLPTRPPSLPGFNKRIVPPSCSDKRLFKSCTPHSRKCLLLGTLPIALICHPLISASCTILVPIQLNLEINRAAICLHKNQCIFINFFYSNRFSHIFSTTETWVTQDLVD